MCGKQTLPPFILGKSRMRKRARTDLCGGRSAMSVPTATMWLFLTPWGLFPSDGLHGSNPRKVWLRGQDLHLRLEVMSLSYLEYFGHLA